MTLAAQFIVSRNSQFHFRSIDTVVDASGSQAPRNCNSADHGQHGYQFPQPRGLPKTTSIWHRE